MSPENMWSKNELDTKAAEIIQRAWRRHIDMQVYKYYRDLIKFNSRGSPSHLLRCINPNEAKLLDAAAGVTVKFRLAGERFPPNIYYKIFTNRPIQDLCANSPKDYTSVTAKQLPVKIFHGRSFVYKNLHDDKRGWYKRNENNGWRLVSDRLIHHIMSDPVTWETSKTTHSFDHNRLQRKRDVERRKKQRKIEWMQKMYKDGMLKARPGDTEMVQLVEDTVAGMMAAVTDQGPQVLEDWEVDELLDWTTGLDFDDYRNSWMSLATSAPSQKHVEEKMQRSKSMLNPYEPILSAGFSVSTTNFSATSSKQSVSFIDELH
ncbi:hypothetical protein BsWGS_12333 [Bradybaena similaris]